MELEFLLFVSKFWSNYIFSLAYLNSNGLNLAPREAKHTLSQLKADHCRKIKAEKLNCSQFNEDQTILISQQSNCVNRDDDDTDEFDDEEDATLHSNENIRSSSSRLYLSDSSEEDL